MVTIAFSDEIVNATELRNNQKFWLDMSSRQPVTIAYGRHSLAILNRERVAKLYMKNHYLELAVKLCTDITLKGSSEEFTWVNSLDDEDKSQFISEFVNSIKKAIMTDDWSGPEILLDDWKATAETLRDGEAMKVLKAKGRRAEYIGQHP